MKIWKVICLLSIVFNLVLVGLLIFQKQRVSDAVNSIVDTGVDSTISTQTRLYTNTEYGFSLEIPEYLWEDVHYKGDNEPYFAGHGKKIGIFYTPKYPYLFGGTVDIGITNKNPGAIIAENLTPGVEKTITDADWPIDRNHKLTTVDGKDFYHTVLGDAGAVSYVVWTKKGDVYLVFTFNDGPAVPQVSIYRDQIIASYKEIK